MNYLGIDYSVKNMPLLDKDFIPFGVWAEAYLKEAAHTFKIAIERENGFVSVFETCLLYTSGRCAAILSGRVYASGRLPLLCAPVLFGACLLYTSNRYV